MTIQKAIITAAGPGQTALPLQRLVDTDGVEKTALAMIIEEVDSAGIEAVGLVIRPDDEGAYRNAAGKYVDRLTFIPQAQPNGYGQALMAAHEFTEGESVLHLVGDHVYLSNAGHGTCAQQLIQVAEQEKCSVSAVQATREKMLPYFGAIGGNRLAQTEDLYEVKRAVEKPTPTLAEQELTVAGFRSGMYLCFFGMHVLSPAVFGILSELCETAKQSVPLAVAMNELASRERYLAVEIQGYRHNMGVKYGLLTTQIALALGGVDRDKVLSELVEQLALQKTAPVA
jgi:UTP--glucose-1-phosphate uridylyltransferase